MLVPAYKVADGPNIDEGITEDNNGEGDQYLIC